MAGATARIEKALDCLRAEVLAELKVIRAQLDRLNLQDALAYDVPEVCARLGCGERQVFNLIRAGKLDPAPSAGRKRMIYAASVEQYLAPTVKARKQHTGGRRAAPVTREGIRAARRALADQPDGASE